MYLDEKGTELDEVVGTVEQIVFKNDENGYTVADVFDDKGDLLTAVGIMPYVCEGDTVMLAGKWTNHANFGRQFAVEYFDRTLPSDETDILRYLSSRNVKGIGPKTAQKIVGKFGGESFDIIENHPEWLADIPGISRKKAEEISESFKEQFGVRNIMMLCRGAFSVGMSMKIFKRYKGNSVEIIKENPYVLCETISGIGFERCDNLARILGIEKDSKFRIKSGIQYVLSVSGEKSGHTYLPLEKLIDEASRLLEVDRDAIDDAVSELVRENKLVRVHMEEHTAIYTKRNYMAESYSAEKLIQLNKYAAGFDNYDKRLFIDRIELEYGVTYAALQRRAIEDAIEHGVMILTGGPGTGKTTVIRAVIRIFENMGMKVALAAPTGRAAKRMSDSTGCEAKTIHRLLEMNREENEELAFRKNENDPIDADVIIVDEASMIGINLLSSLLKAIELGSRLIIIGDSSQLPSVGAGNVLADLIGSKRFCTVTLTEIFRQAEASLIVTNAHAINRGEYPILTSHDRDFFFMSRLNDTEIANTVASLYSDRLPKRYGKLARGIQVICPTRNGISGTENLNRLLQETLNPPAPGKAEKKAHGVVFREGDRVMQIKNNYDIEWEKDEKTGVGIYNGDIGVIESINNLDETMIINFDSRIAEYSFSGLDELEHSYAITVHKSQGSEYPIVILPLGSAAPMLLTRNMLYTAVTRAQNMVIIVGNESVVRKMVDNDRHSVRYTGFSDMLQ